MYTVIVDIYLIPLITFINYNKYNTEMQVTSSGLSGHNGYGCVSKHKHLVSEPTIVLLQLTRYNYNFRFYLLQTFIRSMPDTQSQKLFFMNCCFYTLLFMFLTFYVSLLFRLPSLINTAILIFNWFFLNTISNFSFRSE